MRCTAGALLTRLVRLARSGNKATRLAPALSAQSHALTEQHTAGEVATKRNAAGSPHPTRGDFATQAVVSWLTRCKLPSRYQRLRISGYRPQEESAERCGVSVQTVQRWRQRGGIHAAYSNAQQEYLYEPCLED
jgi:hypothetical protein